MADSDHDGHLREAVLDAVRLYLALLAGDRDCGQAIMWNTPCLSCLAIQTAITGLMLADQADGITFADEGPPAFSREFESQVLADLHRMLASVP